MTDRILAAVSDSTCQKRVTVCVIYGADGNILACESNRCSPDGGRCHRLNCSNQKEGYPSDSDCRWEHAEARAVRALPVGASPTLSVLYGHDFVCPDCEAALLTAGVRQIEVVPAGFGSGLRHDP